MSAIYFSGQGRVYIAPISSGVPQGLIHVGNVPELKITPQADMLEHRESMSGQRALDKRIVRTLSMGFAARLEDWNADNLALALYGEAVSATSGTVTAEVLPTVTVGVRYALANQTLSSVVVKDSAQTPATVPGTKYTVDAVYGAITFSDISGYTQPFKVDYAYGATKRAGMFTEAVPERFVRFEGLNTAYDNKPVLVELYKVALEPIKELALINEDLAALEFAGSVLLDDTKPTDAQLGQFGRIVQIGGW